MENAHAAAAGPLTRRQRQLQSIEALCLLNRDLVCEILGVSRSTFYNRIAAGCFPVVREGGRLKVRRADLQAYIASQTQAAPEDC